MLRFRFPWYLASIVSIISFVVLYAVLLQVSEFLYTFPDEPPEDYALWAGITAIIISSVESVLISKNKKLFSLGLTLLFFLVIFFALSSFIASLWY
ncbi:MAG: hypothetical protein A2134_00940 [Candidatus Woykebacteria bacterium RBG_16_39_9b]|uniref:Uncharacterized protein n=1 Tax=Candidatus Woykebacteria bacterium RBG_16_39_9b TaxID=1802595 RepID=A0A1G1WEN7_9BACT|nr:MAG: hypothetical protein A2134_00940 [Candidatus Woykebacteria bacterium RBG_16_39_9b]